MLLASTIDLAPLARTIYILIALSIAALITLIFYIIKLIISIKRKENLLKFLIIPISYIVLKAAIFLIPFWMNGNNLSSVVSSDSNTIIFIAVALLIDIAAFVFLCIKFKSKPKQEPNSTPLPPDDTPLSK